MFKNIFEKTWNGDTKLEIGGHDVQIKYDVWCMYVYNCISFSYIRNTPSAFTFRHSCVICWGLFFNLSLSVVGKSDQMIPSSPSSPGWSIGTVGSNVPLTVSVLTLVFEYSCLPSPCWLSGLAPPRTPDPRSGFDRDSWAYLDTLT